MAFELRRESPVPSLGVVYQEFVDSDSGAKHIHLQSDSSENGFMVSFPTVPHEDDGRAHILEHLSLCGSEKYPTRDPFFAMTRRSLATFMNAMTYPDRTVYPFASQDRSDFFNLLDVYLDAAFFPTLSRIDFLQEGWRHTFDESGKLAYNGVVFNEMKEPMADPSRALWHGLEKALKPGTTYAFESGGDPLAIPSLSHEELVAFHTTHYHPSRATFWSCGDIDPALIQARINDSVISRIPSRFPRLEPDSSPIPESPIAVDINIPAHGDIEHGHGFHVAWVLGESVRDHDKINDWQIFDHAVSGDSASPLTSALENAGFGRPAGLIGVATDRQACFHIGMEGLGADDVPRAQSLIYSTLETIARDGIPFDRLSEVVRDFELSSREIRGGRMPHGLQTLLSMVSLELNGGDPLRAIDVEADLAKASRDIANPDFIKAMARELLSSQARVEAHAVPDPSFSIERERAETAALERAQGALTPKEAARIRSDNAILLERQRAKPNVACLPKISPKDISRGLPSSLKIEFKSNATEPSTAFIEAPTNGIGYFSVAIDASRVPESDRPWLSLGAGLSTDLGFGSLDYQQASIYRSQRASGVGVGVDAASASASSGSSMALRLRYSAKALERESGPMAQALCETLRAPRFDERERLAFLIQSSFQEIMQNVSQSGSHFASAAASSKVSALGAFSAATGGLEGLRFMTRLDELSRSDEGLAHIQESLERAFSHLADAPCVAIYHGARAGSAQAFEQTKRLLGARAGMARMDIQERAMARLDPSAPTRLALHGPGQLNYCHASWRAPDSLHPDSGPLLVLGAFLGNTFLHRALREEGGAYGGSASYSPVMGCFTMSSYRDPRLEATYDDFKSAIRSAIEGPMEPDDIEEAIISIMQTLDKPGTPREKASASTSRGFSGALDKDRLALRLSILDCSELDLRRVARAHLLDKDPQCAAYVCPKSSAEADSSGMSRIEVLPAPRKAPKP